MSLPQAVRRLARSRAFTLPAVAGLALAIAAVTTMFSVYSAMLLRSLGMDDPARILALWPTDEAHGQKHVEACYQDWKDWQAAADVLEDVALVSSVSLDFPLANKSGEPEHLDGVQVTGNFFRVLGASPWAGRFFTEADDVPGGPLPLVMSYRLWRTHFGADPAVIGRQVRMGPDSTGTVVGIARPELEFPDQVALWVPLRASWPGVETSPRLRVFRSVARLRHGVSVRQAQARMSVVAATAPAGPARYGLAVTSLLDEIYGGARKAIGLLLGAAATVLLIACANVANLLLARGAERAREFAVRTAMGASRGRLIAHALAESVWLAAVAGAAGLVLASSGIDLLTRFAPVDIPRVASASMDLQVLLFGLGMSAATVFVFGLAPALMASGVQPVDALKSGGARSGSGRGEARLRRLSIAAQVAFAAVLLVSAGLLLRSFANLTAVDPGFRAERVLTFRLTTERNSQEDRQQFYSEVLRQVRALPGVESEAAVLLRPLSGAVGWDTVYTVAGQSAEEQRGNPNGNYEAISPDYFRTMGIRLLEGREFAAADGPAAGGVAIVNASTARRHWPGGGAVGGHIRLGRDARAPWLTVVGVAADVRYREWESAQPDFYVPYLQRAQHRSDFVVKTSGDPLLLTNAIRRAVFAIDKEQPVSNVTTLAALVERALGRARVTSWALAVLAATALILAAAGVYGLLAYTVSRRRGEIAIRIALGARPMQVVRQVAAESWRMITAGLALGLAASLVVRDALAALLFGISPLDPWTYAATITVLLLCAAAASIGPARMAAQVDPGDALRGD